MLQKMYTFIIQRGYMGSLIMLTGLAIMSFMDINVMELFRLCRKDLTQACREKMLCRENSNMSIRMMGTGHKVL